MDDADFDPDSIFPPDKFVKIPGVWVFDEHTRDDGHGKKPKAVTRTRLEKMAKVNNSLFRTRGVASAIILGHTKENADETEQPKPIGWAVRYQTDKMLADGTAGLKTDWYIKKPYAGAIDEYPFRSIELWPSTDEITHIALLRTASDRPLPPIKYNLDRGEDPVRYLFTPPPPQSPDAMNPNPAVEQAKVGEAAPVKELAAELADLKEQFAEILPVILQLKELMASDGGDDKGKGDDDLLAPAEDEDDDTDGDEDKKPKSKDTAKEPEKHAAAAAGPTNTFTPSPEPVKMSRETDETVTQYKKEVERVKAENARIAAQNAEFALKFSRMKAEKKVAELESVHRIDFGTADDRENEINLFSRLDDASFDHHAERVLKFYKQKPESKPDSAAVFDVTRYGRTEDRTEKVTEDDIKKLQSLIIKGDYADFLKQKVGD